MALSFSIDGPATGPRYIGSKRKVWTGTVTLDGSYATGGWALTASSFGLFNSIESLNVESFHTKYLFSWDQANQKLKAYKKVVTTTSTAPADSTSGAIIADPQGAATVGVLMGGAASTSYEAVNHAEAGANDSNLNTIVLRVRVEGW